MDGCLWTDVDGQKGLDGRMELTNVGRNCDGHQT
jgi:hypothetical protein